MARYLLSKSAQEDIRDIIAYLHERNPVAARKVRADLRAAMEKLSKFPNIGHMREDQAQSGLRFWRVHSYLIAYDPESRPLAIARVVHGARDLSRMTFGFGAA